MFNGRFMTTIMVPYTIFVACGCGSGLVSCSACDGSGRCDCATCAACGTVKMYDKLTVVFNAPERSESLRPEGLSAEDLEGVDGEVVADERSSWLAGCPSLSADVRPHAAAMIAESQKANRQDVRLLFQRLTVVSVPVFEVHYRYRGRRERCLWVVGMQRRVIAPTAPRAWGRIVAIVVAIVLALLAVAGLLFAAAAWDGTIRLIEAGMQSSDPSMTVFPFVSGYEMGSISSNYKMEE
jgi:hypothetical protein